MLQVVKLFLLVLAIGSGNQAFSQLAVTVNWSLTPEQSDKDLIYYEKKNPLRWVDFQAVPPNDRSPVAAITMSGFGYDADYLYSSNGKGSLLVTLYCFFHKKKSWVKPGNDTREILEHEQHHFDLTYLSAENFRQELLKNKFSTENYESLLEDIYQRSVTRMNDLQEKYDAETQNGTDLKKQDAWNQLVRNRLNSVY